MMEDPFKPAPHPICPHCGSDLVLAGALAIWNQPVSCWELHSTFDVGFCATCETEIRHVWLHTSADLAAPETGSAR